MATSGSKAPSLPPLPTNLDPQLRNYLKQVDTHLKVKAGDSGNPKDRNLTLRDLEASGIVASANTVNDFSITAGDPTVKFIAPNQLITDQVGEENTLKKFSKTSIILASSFSTTVGVSIPSALGQASNHSFLSTSQGGSNYVNNHTRGTEPNSNFPANTSQYVNGQFDFTTAKHTRGGKKPYLITISARRFGIAYSNPSSFLPQLYPNASQPYWTDTIVLLLHSDNVGTILPSSNSHGATPASMENYNNSFLTPTFLNSNEGEVQLSNFRVGIDVVLNPMYVSFVSNLRSETKYRLDLGALTTGVQSPQYNSLQYTIQGLTT